MTRPTEPDAAGGESSPAARRQPPDPKPKRWHCYIVECADGTLYTGITTDLVRRLTAHNRGKGARYTRARLPVRLLWVEPHADRAAASRRESEIKRLPRASKRRLADETG